MDILLDKNRVSDAIDITMKLIRAELVKSMQKHPAMHSPHEGHSVIREELDELWDHVREDTGRGQDAMKEALQVAAMGARYVVDLCHVTVD